jgi:hypothetical protein
MNILTLALLFSAPSIVCSLRGAGQLVIADDGSTNVSPSIIPCPGPFPSKDVPEIAKCNLEQQMVLQSAGGYFCCTLIPNQKAIKQWTTVTRLFGQQKEDRLGYGFENGAGVVLSGNGKRVLVSSRSRDSPRVKASGSVEMYEDNSSPFAPLSNIWTLVGNPIYGETAAEHFGWSTATNEDGTIIAVGSIRFHGSAGSYQGVVRMFKLEEGIWPAQWIKMGNDIYGEELLDYFGFSVSLCSKGNVVAVGGVQHFGIENKPYPGYVNVYGWDGRDHWIQLGHKILGEDDGDRFGSSISLSAQGNILAVGAPDAETGYVMVFGFDGHMWRSIGQTIYSDSVNDKTGYSVALSKNGRTLAIGAPHGGTLMAGVVRVFYLDTDRMWQPTGEIHGEGEEFESGSSIAISADGTRIVIGAIQASGKTDAHEGQIRMFEFQETEWVPVGTSVYGEHGSDNFGFAVSIDSEGRRVAASSPFASSSQYAHAGIVKVLEMQ